MPAAMNPVATLVSLLVCVSCSGAPAPDGSERPTERPFVAPTAEPPRAARPTPQVVPQPDERKPIEGMVLVHQDATFFTWGDRKTARWVGQAIDRETSRGAFYSLRTIASRGDNYEVILEQRPSNVCFDNEPPLRFISLQLWVNRRDVVSAVTAPFSRTYDDGTAIDLVPGVAVTANDGQVATLQSGSISLQIPARDLVIGDVFTPTSRTPKAAAPFHFVDGRRGAALTFGAPPDGGTAFVASIEKRLRGGDVAVNALGPATPGHTLIRVEDPCLELRGKIADPLLQKAGRGWGSGVGCGRKRGSFDVLPGTELFFSDGARAGAVTKQRDVDIRNADWGKHACFLVGTDPICINESDNEAIELCVPREALVARPGK